MVIARLSGGLGNQFAQYVAGRLLAHKLNTELKLDIGGLRILHGEKPRFHAYYRLGAFNIHEVFATPEEIKRVRETGLIVSSPLPNLEELHGDIYMQGQWPRYEGAFIEIIDIVRREFTLKEPFSPIGESWRQKIISAECSVAMHFRHGDFAYNPNLISGDIKQRPWFNIMPLDYYYTCIDILKQRYSNLTAFVFSNNMSWVKDNLHLDVPIEFVEGGASDDEEFILMGLCKHMIKPSSSFSECAVSLNANPDKKIFAPASSTAAGVQQFLNQLTPAKKEAILNTKGWIRIPFDYYNQPEITMRPIFSLLLVVNDDAETISDTLDSLLGQDYKYYEVIIIDNASTDGSDKICRQAIASKKNVTYKRLRKKVNNATAWNRAFKIAQGYYVSFLKNFDQFITNALTSLYGINEYRQVDVIHMFAWLKEGSAQRDTRFKDEKRAVVMGTDGQAAAKLLLDGQINRFLGTKIYNREFLKDNGIKFDEHLADNEAEIFFQIEAFFKSKYFMHISNAFYVAPKA